MLVEGMALYFDLYTSTRSCNHMLPQYSEPQASIFHCYVPRYHCCVAVHCDVPTAIYLLLDMPIVMYMWLRTSCLVSRYLLFLPPG